MLLQDVTTNSTIVIKYYVHNCKIEMVKNYGIFNTLRIIFSCSKGLPKIMFQQPNLVNLCATSKT